jgi:hypothetical protein
MSDDQLGGRRSIGVRVAFGLGGGLSLLVALVVLVGFAPELTSAAWQLTPGDRFWAAFLVVSVSVAVGTLAIRLGASLLRLAGVKLMRIGWIGSILSSALMLAVATFLVW